MNDRASQQQRRDARAQQMTVPSQQRWGSVQQNFPGTAMIAHNGASDAVAAQIRAQTEARWIIAMRQPRDIEQARYELLRMSCTLSGARRSLRTLQSRFASTRASAVHSGRGL